MNDHNLRLVNLSIVEESSPQPVPRMNVNDYLMILMIIMALGLVGYIQFLKILNLEFSLQLIIIPSVMAIIFSVVVTKLRIMKRRLNFERAEKERVKIHLQILNRRLTEVQEHRTELFFEAQNQVVLAQTRANLGSMSAGIIHDLNNALTAIKMGWEGLAYAEEDEIHECQVSVTSGIGRAINICKEFGSFIHPQTREVVEVKGLMLRLMSMLQRSFHPPQKLVLTWGTLHAASPHNLAWSPNDSDCSPSDEVRLYAHLSEAHLTQIMMDLIVNARDALKSDGGEVNVHIQSTGREVVLLVSDDGVGISTELQDQIFQPFFTTKPEGYGTGLGLHVIKSLIHRVNGKLVLESSEDHGSIFTIYLPQSGSYDE